MSPADRERKSAAWPWIVVPIITLGVFFALRNCRKIAPAAASAPVVQPQTEPATTAP